MSTDSSRNTGRRDPVDLRDVAVLIVDDNATNRHLLEGMLLGWSIAPTLAGSVPDALAALRAAQQSGRPFTLALADCQMPDADGCSPGRLANVASRAQNSSVST